MIPQASSVLKELVVYKIDCTTKGVEGNRYCTKNVFLIIQQNRNVRA
jgi:hypothetical protein